MGPMRLLTIMVEGRASPPQPAALRLPLETSSRASCFLRPHRIEFGGDLAKLDLAVAVLADQRNPLDRLRANYSFNVANVA